MNPKPQPTFDDEAIVRSLKAAGFWGELTLKFQHGAVVHIRKTESLDANTYKPQAMRNGEHNDNFKR